MTHGNGFSRLINRMAVLVYPQVEELDFVGFYQVLNEVKKIREDAPILVEIVGTTTSVICANGLVVEPHSLFSNLEGFDGILVPGGPGWKRIVKNETLIQQIREMAGKRKMICSVCTGAFVLGEAGVLEDRRATTHWWCYRELEPYCKRVVQNRIVMDGNVVTAGGVACSLDPGLTLVELFGGIDLKKELSKRLECTFLIKI